MPVRRVGADDGEVEALELVRVFLRREAEWRVVSADSDPKRRTLLGSGRRARKNEHRSGQ